MSHGAGGRGVRPNTWPRTGLLVTVTGVAILTAACSGSPSGASSGGAPAAGSSASPSPGSANSPPAGRPATQQKQLAYSVCMSKHGVAGVPTALPSVTPGSAPRSSGPHWNAAPAGGPNPGSPQWQAAQQACQSLQPRPVAMASG
jgi:hypothetical protein